jgi:2-dehydro-3-deoxy-D-gluconate 5-dehydrogenase
MKALVIGGNKGFGKEVTIQLLNKGYDVITIGRSSSGYENNQHYSCDIGNLKKFSEILKKIASENKALDVLACITGFTRAKPSIKLTSKDWKENLTKNLFYVGEAFQELKESLNKSPAPRVLTIGSQWSYKTGCDVLIPYTISKHALRELTKDFADKERKIKVNHYCVPTMDTPQYLKVKKSAQKIHKEGIISGFSSKRLAKPKIIAKSLIDNFFKTNASGSTFIINPEGKIRKL